MTKKILCVFVLAFVCGCHPSGKSLLGEAEQNLELVPKDQPGPPVLAWESSRREGRKWSWHVHDEIKGRWRADFLSGTDDVTTFCPRYNDLSEDQKLGFWMHLVAAITRFESSYNPMTRYREKTMGKDPVTGEQVHSEGLMQLSYQDSLWAKHCEFDWNKDRALGVEDPRRTIFDPKINLSCGIGILARQIRNKKKIMLPVKQGCYWVVLAPGTRYSKIKEIATMTAAWPPCGGKIPNEIVESLNEEEDSTVLEELQGTSPLTELLTD